jgi:hypothetical protein
VTVRSVTVNANLADPPDLPSGAQPTSWSAQRSAVRTIAITFSEAMAPIAAGDLRLVNLGVNGPVDADVDVALSDGQLTQDEDTLTIAFTPGQLSDGSYELWVMPSAASMGGAALDGDGAGGPYRMRGSAANELFQLTADFNGDGGVSVLDLSAFQYWFGQSLPAAPGYVDLNGDGGASLLDFPTFQSQFGRLIAFDPLPAPVAPAPTADTPRAALPVLIVSGGDAAAVHDPQKLDEAAQTAAAPSRSLLASAMTAKALRLRPTPGRDPFDPSAAPWSVREDPGKSGPDFLDSGRGLDAVIRSMWNP